MAKAIFILRLICALGLGLGAGAQAGFLDYEAGAGLRTVPLGAAAYVKTGWNELLWGEKSNHNFLYGYLRPTLRLQSSVVVNQYDMAVDLYPISIFGFTTGFQQSFRSKDASQVDCVANQCQGNLKKIYVTANLLLGYQQFFLGAHARLDQVSGDGTHRQFYDEGSALLGSLTSSRDSLVSHDYFAGYSWNSRQSSGLYYYAQRFAESHNVNHQISVFHRLNYRIDSSDLELTLGAGLYDSTLRAKSGTFYVLLRWVGVSSLAIN